MDAPGHVPYWSLDILHQLLWELFLDCVFIIRKILLTK